MVYTPLAPHVPFFPSYSSVDALREKHGIPAPSESDVIPSLPLASEWIPVEHLALCAMDPLTAVAVLITDAGTMLAHGEIEGVELILCLIDDAITFMGSLGIPSLGAKVDEAVLEAHDMHLAECATAPMS